MNGRPVDQIDVVTKQIIATYTSAIYAARSVGSNYPQGIRRCCNGKATRHRGFMWKYADTEKINTPKPRRVTGKRISIMKLNPQTGGVLATYPTVCVAAQENNTSTSGISRCCAGEYKTHMGFKWAYADTQPLENMEPPNESSTLKKKNIKKQTSAPQFSSYRECLDAPVLAECIDIRNGEVTNIHNFESFKSCLKHARNIWEEPYMSPEELFTIISNNRKVGSWRLRFSQ